MRWSNLWLNWSFSYFVLVFLFRVFCLVLDSVHDMIRSPFCGCLFRRLQYYDIKQWMHERTHRPTEWMEAKPREEKKRIKIARIQDSQDSLRLNVNIVGRESFIAGQHVESTRCGVIIASVVNLSESLSFILSLWLDRMPNGETEIPKQYTQWVFCTIWTMHSNGLIASPNCRLDDNESFVRFAARH